MLNLSAPAPTIKCLLGRSENRETNSFQIGFLLLGLQRWCFQNLRRMPGKVTANKFLLSSRLFLKFTASFLHHVPRSSILEQNQAKFIVLSQVPIKTHLHHKSNAGMTSRKLLWLICTALFAGIFHNFIINGHWSPVHFTFSMFLLSFPPFPSYLSCSQSYYIYNLSAAAPQTLIEYAVRALLQKPFFTWNKSIRRLRFGCWLLNPSIKYDEMNQLSSVSVLICAECFFNFFSVLIN